MAKKSKGKNEVLEQEDILQGLVVADSFNTKFAPLTIDKPRALLPLVNIPLLDYTLEFLASSAVQEIFVLCGAHGDQIKEHINSSKWSSQKSPCTVTTIFTEGCTNIGDALRDMGSKSFLRSHFVLVTGDVVSNMQLAEVIEIHKNRFMSDKLNVMTLLYKTALPGHRTRCPDDEFIIASDQNKKILNFQKMGVRKKLRLPLNLFEENSSMDIRHDLMDTHVCICTPRVIELFVDNFDYKTKEDLIKGVLINEEIEGNKLYLHVVKDEYSARVSNLPMYDSVSKDILHRWTFPMVPDHMEVNGDNYALRRHNVYMAKDVSVGRNCSLEEDVVVGSDTTIGDRVVIRQSIIGKRCRIGNNVTLTNAYLWDDVIIEDDSQVTMAIVCNRAHVKTGTTIQEGSLLSFEVKVGPSVVLPIKTLLTRHFQKELQERDDFDEEVSNSVSDNAEDTKYDLGVIGQEGEGHIWNANQLLEEEEEDLVQQMLGLNVSKESSDESEESTDESDFDEDGMSPSSSPPPDDTKLFYTEVLDSIQRTLEENVKVENLILEVNSSKYAYNISMKELNQLVTKAVLDIPHLKSEDPLQPPQLLASLKKVFKRLLSLFSNYIKSAESQFDMLIALENYSLESAATATILPKLLHSLYEDDILGEEVIVHWFKKPSEADDNGSVERRQEIKSKVAPFVTWLEEADEESEDEDD